MATRECQWNSVSSSSKWLATPEKWQVLFVCFFNLRPLLPNKLWLIIFLYFFLKTIHNFDASDWSDNKWDFICTFVKSVNLFLCDRDIFEGFQWTVVESYVV